MKQLTVSIGIPAYNEEANIDSLLEELLAQRSKLFELKSIIIYSDGSTDQTEKKVLAKKNKHQNIILIKGPGRLGVRAGLNAIIAKSSSEVLVILNADTAIKSQMLEKIIRPFILDKSVGLVTGNIKPILPFGWFEKVLYYGMLTKQTVYEKYRDGQNFYTCYGPIRAMRKSFYKKLHFESGIADDMYTYFTAKSLGVAHRFVKDAVVYFRLPTNFRDHRRQSLRFWSLQPAIDRFGKDLVSQEMRLPIIDLVNTGLVTAFRHPVETISYFGLVVFCRLLAFVGVGTFSDTWQIAESSKLISREGAR